MSDGHTTVWRIIAHHVAPDVAAKWAAEMGLLAIGCGDIGDLRAGRFPNARSIAREIRKTYPYLNNSGSGGACLYDFLHRMEIGDLVIISAGGRRQFVMEVEGDYEFSKGRVHKPIGDYQHQRRASSLKMNPDELWREAGGRPATGHNIRWTLIECAKPIDGDQKSKLLSSAARRTAP
jgi:hypothetical protein